ncbi:helix-turn-helix domain-containing protein [Micromonospora tarensis]|uniref:LysR family transcriptional regulator n=1 Tax=Micromonospora tarensis TaxID=2806100 RepID=A0ABS1YCE5_9ACTN|nr:LysR family transcriptional regulator [Micromonospora tarensis]
MLDILRLRVLAAIAEHGSVTQAARRLNYSQPAVSHHLARLEAATGARLVQRGRDRTARRPGPRQRMSRRDPSGARPAPPDKPPR